MFPGTKENFHRFGRTGIQVSLSQFSFRSQLVIRTGRRFRTAARHFSSRMRSRARPTNLRPLPFKYCHKPLARASDSPTVRLQLMKSSSERCHIMQWSVPRKRFNMRSRILRSRRLLISAIFSATAAAVTNAEPSRQISIVQSNNAFAVDLYRKLSDEPGNLFFSPSSISGVLAMAAVGARGTTEQEMAKVLHLPLPPGHVADAFLQFATLLGQMRPSEATLTIANSLWLQLDYRVADAFLHLVRSRFQAEIHTVDFLRQPDAVCLEINRWVDRKTQGKITALISRDSLTAQTRLVLCNAIYFKGRWAHQFEPRLTESSPFSLNQDARVFVPTMRVSASFKSVAVDGLNLLELPYQGQELSMVVLLPAAMDGLAGVERQLGPENLGRWLEALDQARPTEVRVSLPRFQTSRRFALEQPLARLGMRAAFDPAAADFSGITGRRDLAISTVIHQAYVEVNEEGTKAAAATGGVVVALAVHVVPEFKVDHPFLFLIRENRTGCILFFGRMNNPNG